jgi:DNA-binding NtrC family response regulator
VSDTKILLVEDDNSLRSTISTFLELEQYNVDAVGSTREALVRLRDYGYPIVVSDIYLDERTGLDILSAARERQPDCKVILMTGRASMETVMKATQGGMFEYLPKPFELDDLLDVVQRAEKALSSETTNDEDPETGIDDLPESDIVACAPAMVAVYKTIAKVAPTDATVLIQGETGTGKELIARSIHRNSPRANHPFAAVDCGTIAPSLLESELFGALKGSYTGADRDRVGVFEAAHKGTVFLDEIGDIDQSFQAKLLRFLQEREVRPLGAQKAKAVDVRVISATNKNMQKMVDEGKFREDLWFRLNTVPIDLPPLRERAGDVQLLAHTFLGRYNERYQQPTKLLGSGLKALEEYTWPGNVRQLQHLIERLSILAPENRIDAAAVRRAIAESQPGGDNVTETLADAEADQIRKVMTAVGNNKSRAARILGIERKTLYRKLERLGIT